MSATSTVYGGAWRHPALVAAIMHTIDAAGATGITWADLVDTLTGPERTWRTVERAIYDLAAFGAVQRTGRHTTRTDTRRLRMTTLGEAWLNDTTPPPYLDPEEAS